MVPRLDSYVYLVYKGCISKEKVYLKGSKSFCTRTAFDPMFVDEVRVDYLYEDYGETWFSTLKGAKERMRQEGYTRFQKLEKDYWEGWCR